MEAFIGFVMAMMMLSTIWLFCKYMELKNCVESILEFIKKVMEE